MEIDYKKEYEAMVQRARELHETGNELTKRQMEIVCQELRESESEDEMIRKELIAILKASYNSGITLNNKKDLDRYLAYLEKQKEQRELPLMDGDAELYFDDWNQQKQNPTKRQCFEEGIRYAQRLQKEQKLIDLDQLRRDIYQSGYNDGYQHGKEDAQKEQKPPIAGNDFGWIDELKHDLEHPEELDQKVDDVLKQRKGIRALEWSDEEKDKFNRIERLIVNANAHGNSLIGDKEAIELQHFIRSLVKPITNIAGWSEEDEKMINHIIEALPIWANEQITILPSQAEEYIKRLKSLRPQKKIYDGPWRSFTEKKDAAEEYAIQAARYPIKESEYLADLEDAFISGVEWKEKKGWKPSEEQMDALNALNCHGAISYVGQQGYLISLYNDLKKLM